MWFYDIHNFSFIYIKFLTCLRDGSMYFLPSQSDCLGSILVLSTRHRMEAILRDSPPKSLLNELFVLTILATCQTQGKVQKR